MWTSHTMDKDSANPAKGRNPRFKRKPSPQPSKDSPQHLRPDQHIDPDVPITHQKLIGKVVVLWAKVENAMQDAIWQFLGLEPEDGRILTARNDAQDNILMLRSFAKRYLDAGRFEEFDKTVLKVIEARQEDRNIIVHGAWGTLKPERTPISTVLRRKSDVGEIAAETFSDSRMRQIVDDLSRALDDVAALATELAALRDIASRPSPLGPNTPDASGPAAPRPRGARL
jgi:hypothetical protein